MKHFVRISHGIDTAAALAQLEANAALWDQITVREKYDGTAHADTRTIVMRGPTSLEGIFDNLDAVDFDAMGKLPAVADLLRPEMERLKVREYGRVMVVKLKAGGRIACHVDEGAYARYFARFHLVLDSNPRCVFKCGQEVINMRTGELWWFNHQVRHGVENDGPARTHVIFDVCAPGFTGAIA